MTDDELKQFGELAKKFEAKDKDTVMKIVKTDIHPVFQDINDGGRAAANADNATKLTTVTTERDQFKTRAETAENTVKEYEKKAPDVVSLRQKYEADLTEERRKHGDELAQRDKEAINIRLDVAKQKLVDRLASKYEVDREYAETVLANRQDIVDRMQVDKSGVKVLKAGSKDLHIVPAEGREALDHLAEEVAEGVADKWKGSKVRKGSETREGSGKKETPNRFDAVRERANRGSEAKKKAKESGSALERLGGRGR